MDEGKQNYVYVPVTSSPQGIRIAILEPASDFSTPLHCSLLDVSLDSRPQYEAISYVWGDPTDQTTIFINNLPSKITRSLEIFLRYIRLPNQPRRIWADAVCIDQTNVQERNEQVKLMKEVYSYCERDLIWLGEENECTKTGIQGLKEMKALGFQRKPDSDLWKGEFKDLNNIAYNRHISSIINRPRIWERGWVMQEISCAPEVLLIIGHQSLDWSIVSAILDHSGTPDWSHGPWSHGMTTDQMFWTNFTRVQVISHQRDSVHGLHRLNSTLLDVLSRFRLTYCSDQRDKVYSYLGLATDAQQLGIVPDYGMDARDVFVEVAKKYIEAKANIDIITQSMWPLGDACYAYYTGTAREVKTIVANLPSWVPNFSCTISTDIMFAQRRIFSAGVEKISLPLEVSPSGALKIPGILVGKIEKLTPMFDLSGYVCPWSRSLMPIDLQDKNVKPKPYPTGGDRFEAFWRTVLRDCLTIPTRRLSPEDINRFALIFSKWRGRDGDGPRNFDYNCLDELVLKERDVFRDLGKVEEETSLRKFLMKWQFAEIEGGLFGMVPWEGRYNPEIGSKVGDLVLVVEGGKVPLIVRPVDRSISSDSTLDERVQMIGTGYLHGFMDGLAEEWADKSLLDRKKFDIV
ncbi:heterokaryon incompatibility protein-domain-containing protein [Tricladium varicosporioides]|nr:heterokaryon incompatibility protein-domain-containing protein [Hymenoscyphus varicosporioides]